MRFVVATSFQRPPFAEGAPTREGLSEHFPPLRLLPAGGVVDCVPACRYFVIAPAPFAAFSMSDATACGCDTYTAWLPLTSTTFEPARLDIAR